MTRTLFVLAALATVAACANRQVVQQQPPAPVYTQPVTLTPEEQAVLDRAVREKLIDPASGIITGVRAAKGAQGTLACGWINSKNRMGGYAGGTPFNPFLETRRVIIGQERYMADVVLSVCRNNRIPLV